MVCPLDLARQHHSVTGSQKSVIDITPGGKNGILSIRTDVYPGRRLARMADDSNNTLKLPLQDLDTFPHFALQAEAAASWAQTLPAGNAMKSGSDLRMVLS